MKIFKYKALSKKGNKQSGVILADSSKVAYQTICEKELIPIDISKVRKTSSQISTEELLMFFMHIDFQLKCGLKINEAIDTFTDSQNNKIFWMNGDEFHMKKSVVEEEITIASKLRIVSISTGDNVGVGFVALV